MNPENTPLPPDDEQDNTADESRVTTDEAPAEAEGDNESGLNEADNTDVEPPADDTVADESPAAEQANETATAVDDQDEPDDADVIFDGERPIVQELQYKAPRAGNAADEDGTEGEGRFSSVAEARAVIEGFLFSSNEPLSVARLSKLMGNLHPKTVRGLLLELQWEYENRSSSALQVVEIAGGYQMATRPFVAPWMFRLHKLKRRSPLSPATLETLAIIAYRQPITKGEMETIRGVETGAPLRTLQELGLVEARGRREVIGRPQLYVTTENFLKVFGLKSIADLPSISELKSKFAEEQRLKPQTAAAPPEKPDEPAEEDESANAADPQPAEALTPAEEEAEPAAVEVEEAEAAAEAAAVELDEAAEEAAEEAVEDDRPD